MKFDLIFYQSKKTSLCEKKLSDILNKTSIFQNTTAFATTPIDLGQRLVESLNCCYLVFVVGNLSTGDSNSFTRVISRAIANSNMTLSNTKKLRSLLGPDGYIISCGKQVIVALPDDPCEIESMLSHEVMDYISRTVPTE